jgi:hypothetical protein
MPVWMAQELIPSREFTEWMMLEEADPWGQRRADWHAAQICATIANAFRDTKKRPEPYTAKDALLNFDLQGAIEAMGVVDIQADPEEDARRRTAELWSKVGSINALLGGTVADRKDN